jgi:hypothetical protein
MKIVIRLLLVLGVVLGSGWLPETSTQAMPAAEVQASADAPVALTNLIPAQPPGAVLPTINLSASHGKTGEAITVSGQGVSPYPGVRVTWLLSDATLTAAVVNIAAGNAYAATITVPTDAAPGPARVCAAVTGTTLAGFACANFTIDPIAPGSVQGAIPLTAMNAPARSSAPQAITATVKLYDQQGRVIGSAPIQDDGTFNVGAVPPGSYTAGVAGIVPVLVTTRTVSVQSAQMSSVNFTPFTQCLAASVVAVRITPTGKPTSQYDFGTYLSFWPYSPDPKPVMEADLQVVSGANVSGVAFKVTDVGGDTIVIGFPGTPAAGTTYAITRTIGDWLPGINLLKIEPSVTYPGHPGCYVAQPTARRVNVIQHPMTPNVLQHNNDRRIQDTKWDGSRYVFNVDMPDYYDSFDIISPPPFFQNGEQILPTTFPNPAPDLDYLGVSENKHGAAFSISGTLDLDGNVTFTAVRGRTGAFALSQRTIDGQYSFIPESIDGIPALAMLPAVIDEVQQRSGLLAPAAFPPTFSNLRDVHVDLGPETLFPFDVETPVYEGVLFTLFGLANVRVSISVGVSGDVVIQGTVWPLAPDIDVRARARVSPRVDVDVIGDILGVVAVGGTARTEGTVSVPAHVSTKDDRLVWLEDPCMRIKVILYLWMSIGIGDASKTWNLDPQTLLDYTNGACSAAQLATAPDAVPTRPRLFSAPNVISGPGGRMLSVHVEDTSPGTTNPVPKVMARFWDTANHQWGSAFALTDGTHMVQDPVGAFHGGGDNAIVAWTETFMTLAEEQAAGNDLNAMLNRQEIFYAVWNGSQWSAPTRLTSDVVSDGQASFAGDDFGATLAWVRDTDGLLSTRQDVRIAVQDWNASGSISGTTTVLSTTLNSMASQVAVARSSSGGVSRRALAWITDLDGDVTTGIDRDIAIADWNGSKWNVAVPVIAALLNAPEAPSLALVPGSQDLYLTFVERRKDPSGVDSGFGNNSVLWTARRTGSSWQAAAALDEKGQRVRAERPQISIGSGGEPLVAFRRFGTVGTTAELGQLALTKLAGNGAAAVPLYLTDEGRQHWQQSIAINSTSDQAVVVSVGRAASSGASIVNALEPADAGARPLLKSATRAIADDTIESLVVEPGADPALDTKLVLSSAHAAPGTNVVVTATLRNLGRATATGLTVNLYSGLPFTGTLIGMKIISDTAFNGSRVVTFTVTTNNGAQPIYAHVTTGGSNVSTANDVATADLGALLPPPLVIVRPSPRHAHALEIAWQPPAIAGIEGYRVLRSLTPGGPFELVGEATGILLVDLPVQRGTTYTYAVQSYDASGVLSELSAEVTGMLPLYNLYLPLIRR